ncbi:MAG: phosphoenolpyruvate carboxykinase domain-containing protein, partial [Thermoanaerobaculia bacterium]|nr:phosphoenolpyruvate carboxykinase domain-containing protein [Thermoanaerobaculia bacterium]
QAFNWTYGVYSAATMGSETTAAAVGATGEVRRDPMAMLPFCGYHMGSYFNHWVDFGRTLPAPPRIFSVNWFRKDAKGNFVWPGFGDNMRILKWIIERARGRGRAHETPLGWAPAYEDIEWQGLDFSKEKWDQVMSVDKELWHKEIVQHEELFVKLYDRLPKEFIYVKELITSGLWRTPKPVHRGYGDQGQSVDS